MPYPDQPQISSAAASLGASLTLPGGVTLKNRIVKAAMSEQLADLTGAPGQGLATLYGRWARGGVGLLITGNVMVDGRSLGEPKNVVIEDERHSAALQAWAAAAHRGGAAVIAQLNHPGRQSLAGLSQVVVAPSAVPVPGGAWANPRAMTAEEIRATIWRFAESARVMVEAGFDGVQLHAAHGYLISQFLSPLVNRRNDEWGGDAQRRQQFLLTLVRTVRSQIGPDKILAVKLNSADFQRGGFTEEESLAVIAALDGEGLDLLEISGGTYESPAFMGPQSDSTQRREAYFLEFAEKTRAVSSVPLLVTGGFRTGASMSEALATGATDLVGLARPLTLEPDLASRLLADATASSSFALPPLRIGALNGPAGLGWSQHQLARMAAGKEPDPRYGPRRAAATFLLSNGINTLRRRRG